MSENWPTTDQRYDSSIPALWWDASDATTVPVVDSWNDDHSAGQTGAVSNDRNQPLPAPPSHSAPGAMMIGTDLVCGPPVWDIGTGQFVHHSCAITDELVSSGFLLDGYAAVLLTQEVPSP